MNEVKEKISIDLIGVVIVNLLLSTNFIGFIGLYLIVNTVRDLFDIRLYASFLMFAAIYFLMKSTILPVLYSYILNADKQLNTSRLIFDLKTNKAFRQKILKYSFFIDMASMLTISVCYTLIPMINGSIKCSLHNLFSTFLNTFPYILVDFILFGGGLFFSYLILFMFWNWQDKKLTQD